MHLISWGFREMKKGGMGENTEHRRRDRERERKKKENVKKKDIFSN